MLLALRLALALGFAAAFTVLTGVSLTVMLRTGKKLLVVGPALVACAWALVAGIDAYYTLVWAPTVANPVRIDLFVLYPAVGLGSLLAILGSALIAWRRFGRRRLDARGRRG